MCGYGLRPTYLAEIAQRLATDVGYTDASGLGCKGVWIYPNEDFVHYVWRLHWPEDIKANLVSSDNPQGQITNSDLELATLVLQEATFLFVRTILTLPDNGQFIMPFPYGKILHRV